MLELVVILNMVLRYFIILEKLLDGLSNRQSSVYYDNAVVMNK
jgi:hypothetical protein